MSLESRNPQRIRPDAGLRWGGRILFLTAILLITDLALQPGYEMPARLFGPDKVEHVAAFLVLTLLGRIAWPSLPVWILAILLSLYGLGIEIAQAMDWVGRTASLADFAADGVGIVLGLGMHALASRFLSSSRGE